MVGIILLFVRTCIIPAIAQNTEKSQSTSGGNWLYVGGSGPGNYSKIQDAIDNSSDGDTIFVYDDSSPYYEHISVIKSIMLIGEENDTVIIDGGGSGDVITVTTTNTQIRDFTIQNSNNAGIYIFNSDNILINGNKISNNYDGLILKNITDCFLQNNIISNNGRFGIWCREYCNYCNISDNIINENGADGIHLDSSNNNIINRNSLIGNLNGIHISGSQNNIILMNNIERNREKGIRLSSKNSEVIMNNIVDNHEQGLFLQNCVYIIVKKNNFINNNPNAFFDYTTYSFFEILSSFKNSRTNTFEGNYWNRMRLLPVKIKGTIRMYYDNPWMPPEVLSCSRYDFFPTRQSYNIRG